MSEWRPSGVPWYAHPEFCGGHKGDSDESLSAIDGRAKTSRRRLEIILSAWSEGDVFRLGEGSRYHGYPDAIFQFTGASVNRRGELLIHVQSIRRPSSWKTNRSRLSGTLFWHCAERMERVG